MTIRNIDNGKKCDNSISQHNIDCVGNMFLYCKCKCATACVRH